MSVRDEIFIEIEKFGSMTIDRYMEICNTYYYQTRDPLGANGDFTTAPEICQIFGEIIAVWVINKWQALGAPKDFALVELGAGRGTLMADLLRAAKVVSDFQPQIHIVEFSEVLRDKQKISLPNTKVTWHDELPKLEIPAIIIANEFFDALPIKQLIDLQEREIIIKNGELEFTHKPQDVVEISPASEAIMREIAENYQGGIIIDYGYVTGSGDTFQALHKHKYVNPLRNCGETDLTAHVNFSALSALAPQPSKITTQGEFLLQYGGGIRAKKLGLEADFARLVTPEQMGELFKVLTF